MLTEEHLKNLDRLATKLESLPEGYQHFSMETYCDLPWDQEIQYARKNGGFDQFDGHGECGTVACAVGHGPSAGILVPEGMINSPECFGVIDWNRYSGVVFGTTPYRHDLYSWLFHESWALYDNHHWGAAARIRYALNNDCEPPEEFSKPCDYWVSVYAPYRITEPKPLPADFYDIFPEELRPQRAHV